MAQQRYCGIPCIMEELGPEPWLLDNFVPEEPIVILYSIPGKGHFVWADFCLIVIWVFCERISCIKLRKERKKKGQLLGDVSHDSPVGVLFFSCCLFWLCFAITVIPVTGFFCGCAACFQYIMCWNSVMVICLFSDCWCMWGRVESSPALEWARSHRAAEVKAYVSVMRAVS